MVHHLDPIIGTLFGVHVWWYGLSYATGFTSAHLVLRRHRQSLGLSLRSVYNLTLLIAVGVLVGGRAVVVNNEWFRYREHPAWIPALWMGGLATHGLIIGGAAAVLLYAWATHRPFRPLLDSLAIGAALILACGRVGNFIDGQIVGRVTDLPWGVTFPNAEGFRHPVVLYDGLKNLLIVPVLLAVLRRRPPAGRAAALFVLLYAAPRIAIDRLREYPLTLMGLPSGQTFNIGMAVVGVALVLKSLLRPGPSAPTPAEPEAGPGWRIPAFAAILLFVLTIPSDATRDVPTTYGARHPGLVHSALYPRLGP
jgi:phosphatidylglycerol---prolipoprotein diacylglyceryl transferase